MNIIIPLGGKGERFLKKGFNKPKPLIPIFDITMIEYVLNNLSISDNDKIFIIYNYNLDNYNFSNFINDKYANINLIKINDTKGAVETLLLGLEIILNQYVPNEKCLILDCDTFYTENIVEKFRNSDNNLIFYTKNIEKEPIYSYIQLDDSNNIININEKVKISDNANTGAYGFININILVKYCKYVIDNNITFNNEPYTSCVISEMIKNNILFKGLQLNSDYVFSLGTPEAVTKYIDNTYAFLFDLDGTLVVTDEIYYNVWSHILLKYNIVLDRDIFCTFIQGNNDKSVVEKLLKNIDISLDELSKLKDDLFIENIDKIKIIEGIYNFIDKIKQHGYKLCVVTNCNKKVADIIIKKIGLKFDFIISSNDCINGKPNPEPYNLAINKYNINNKKCFIFEDSKTGLISGKSVNPKLLIGIETIYSHEELFNFGVNLTFKNYKDICLMTLINTNNINKNSLIKLIEKNSIIYNIKNIDLSDSLLKGGFIADILKFYITTHENKTYSQILKVENLNNNNLSNMAKQLDLYNREYYFYTNIAVHLKKVNIPKFYNLILNDEYQNYGIVLENLFEKNYKINLNLNNENIDITLKIIDRMAYMHSLYWSKNLKKIFPKLNYSNDKIFNPFLSNFINEKKDLFLSKWIHNLNKNQLDICLNIFNNFSLIQDSFSKGNNLTFIHGDIKSPNIFYDTENLNEPYFIDWQHCAIGKGTQDLIFFIIESFNMDNLLFIFNLAKNYYFLKLKEYGINNYSFEDYEKDLYDSICYIPFFTSIWFGTVPQDELIDKNFPYFFISKMFYLLDSLNKN